MVKQPNNFYWNNFIDIHGKTSQQIANAPTLDKVWEKIEPFIKDQQVLVHNVFAFDFLCLEQTLAY